MPYSNGVKPVVLPPRARQTRDEAGPHRVDDARKNDRDGSVRLLQGRERRIAAGRQDDVGRESDQLRCLPAKDLRIAVAVACIDPHVAAIRPAQLL